ncbi:unnamed protein product [Tilletia caries]|nr:unnamed protein product [Tilletia caries]CAD7066460.1 unnamed protein product [Tilletia caries]
MLRPSRKQSLPNAALAGFDPAQLVNAPPSPSPYQGQSSYFGPNAGAGPGASAGPPGSMTSSAASIHSIPPTPSSFGGSQGLSGSGFNFPHNGAPNSPAGMSSAAAATGTGSSTPQSGLGPGGAVLAFGAPQAASTIGNRPAIAGSSLYQACLSLRDRLWCVDGFGHAYLDPEGPLVAAAIAATAPEPGMGVGPSASSDLPSPSTPTTPGPGTPTGLGVAGMPGGTSSSPAGANHVSLDASEPVSKLWATFRLGTPLCALFNALYVQPIDASLTSTTATAGGEAAAAPVVGQPKQKLLTVNNDLAYLRYNPRECKKLAAHFIMAIKKDLDLGHDEIFSVSDLYLDDTNGFVKVVRTVSKLVDVFATRGLLVPSQDPASGNADESASAARGGLAWSVNELLNTERKYVQDLEAMQSYARALQTYNILAPDTIHDLFGNLNALVDVSRRFLITVEENARRPPDDQHFGHAVMAMESDFAVYEPFCANYNKALDTITAETQNLLRLKELPGSEEFFLTPNYELPSLLIKPVQRICKYPLLLEQIIKNTPADATHREELVDGLHVLKRIAEKVNETQRMQENVLVVKELEERVDDWKGHNVNQFGTLLLHEPFGVLKNDQEREYHVYLFEAILLCCKENPALPPNPKDKKKKDKKGSTPLPLGPKKNTTPLQVKGRIFTVNMTAAMPQTVLGVPGGPYCLNIWWRNDHDVETLGLKCKNEEQLNKWKNAVNRAIEGAMTRRRNGAMPQMMGNMAGAGANGRRLTNGSSNFPMTPLSDQSPFPYRSDMDPGYAVAASSRGPMSSSQSSLSQASGAYGVSRFSQPAEHRERKISISQEAARPRALTEDQNGSTMAQWRSHSPNPSSGSGGGRPPMPRSSGSSMANSPMPEGAPMPPTLRKASSSRQIRPLVGPLQTGGGIGGGGGANGLPSRMVSQQRINTGDGMEFMDGAESSPGADSFGHGFFNGPKRLEDNGGLSRSGSEGLAAYRNRSTSNPQQYVPLSQGQVPPLPRQPAQLAAMYGAGYSGQHGANGAHNPQGHGTPSGRHPSVSANQSGFSDERRLSSSSFSTIDSVQSVQSRPDSSQSSSGSTFKNGAGGNGIHMGVSSLHHQASTHSLNRSATPLANNSLAGSTSAASSPGSLAVKLIINHAEEKFTIVVLQSINYVDLQDKVTKKLRLCSGRKVFPDSGVRIRYVDEDGDVVAMTTDEDVQMAFDAWRKTRQEVTLIVS